MALLSHKLTSLTNAQICDIIRKYEAKWDALIEPSTMVTMYCDKLGISTQYVNVSLEDTETKFNSYNRALLDVGTECQKRNLMNTQKEENIDNLIVFNKTLEKVHYAQHILRQYYHYTNTEKNGYDFNANIDATMFKFNPIVFEDLKPFQKLVFILFDHFASNNLRKHGECVYEEIMTPHHTHAWNSKCTILDMINEQCNMVGHYDRWALITSMKDMDKQIADYFIRCKDSRFPDLIKNRNVFSFKNGIYFSNVGNTYKDKFIKYESSEMNEIDKHTVSCKYFDQDFKYSNTCEPEDVHTPVLDSIYKYQGLDEDVIVINKMFLGRMLYDTNTLDNWQVIMMLLGSGGSGKSTINNIVRMFYEHEDVGIMSNNYQRLFGLADIYDKFAFIAPEIKKDWGIDQAEFQEIVSGGKVNVNIKHRPSIRVEWKAPGMLGGNENPGFVDNACSIQRRVVVTRFDLKVENGDPQLGRKLEQEIDSILKQCNLFYLRYAEKYTNKDIWKWLPDYFLETQKMMAAASNALYAYMDSDLLEFESAHLIPMDEFFKRFNLFCAENNFTRPKINVDFYRTPFAKYKIELKKGNFKYYGKMYKNTTFLFGVQFKLQNEDFESDL